MLKVLYEDNHLLVVEKPVNMPVQADASGDKDLLTLCKQYVKEKYDKPGEVYLGLVHRLDRPVGGVLVFARTSKAAARLTNQFSDHTAKKRYAAVVCGKPGSGASLTDWLVKDEATFSSRVVPEGTPEAKLARLRYSTLARSEDTALVDVELYTGRPHQIRVQMAQEGLPLWGDQRYNPAARPGQQIALWAYALTIHHPTLNEPMTFFSAPQGAAFSAFPAQVALLPAFSAARGIFLSDELVVVDKNAGVETEGELLIELSTLFPEIYPVHRLDANTEGIVVFARTPETRDRLSQRFYEHDLQKVYHAVVRGVPPETGEFTDFLKKDGEAAMVRVVPPGTAGALTAKLRYRRLAENGAASLLEIQLLTGRTHQIRVQMAHAGYPILGDDQYGDRAFNKACKVKTQALLSKRLTLEGQTYESLRELTLPQPLQS